MATIGMGGITATSGTSTTFPVGNLSVSAVDVAGTLAPVSIQLAPNICVLLTAVKTDTEVTDAMLAYCARFSRTHDGAGGTPSSASLQKTETLTTV